MNSIVKLENVEDKIILIREAQVLLDSDVAKIYGVETKRINEAVKNNLDRFPDGYIIELSKDEWDSLKSKFSTSKRGITSTRHSRERTSFPRKREPSKIRKPARVFHRNPVKQEGNLQFRIVASM